MTDLRRTGLNNQKREPSIAVASLVEADVLLTGSIYATLPPRSVITAARINVKTASGTAGATLDIVANGVVVANEVPVDAVGAIAGTVSSTAAYLATGGNLEVRAGAVTPANGAFVGDLIVEYIELDKVNGEYTN